MRYAPVNDVGFAHTGFDGLDTGFDFGNHPTADHALINQLAHLRDMHG